MYEQDRKSGRALWLVALAACATDAPGLPAARFANQPIVWKVDDQRDVRASPKDPVALIKYDFYYRSFHRPLTRSLELRRTERARGVNALDEVPDSTWFTNRIGTHDLTPEQVHDGPTERGGPEAFKPWTVRSTKFGGGSPGMIVTDTQGVKYVLKFEPVGAPELTSGAEAVTSRLLWACGYNVPENYVVYFRPEDLVLAPDAKLKTASGSSRGRLDRGRLDRVLAAVDHTSDGQIRALASRWIAGTNLGGTADEGVRSDDPSDRIPHQQRRDLRGAYAILEWVDNVDLQIGNSIDVLVTDPPKQYVKHYRLDFDGSLGAMAALDHALRIGYANLFDWSDMLAETSTLGLRDRPWLDRDGPALRGVSPGFTGEFDPGSWKPDIPVSAFDDADRFDQFWGAKIVARFTPAQIRAAVEAGRYSDPRAVEYLTRTLIARQRAIVAYWFAHVSPLDHVTANAGGICFDDLAIAYGLASPAATQYRLVSHNRAGREIARAAAVADASGSTCVAPLAFASDRADGYTIVEIVTTRARTVRTLYVHLARDPATGEPRVIGIWRV